LHESEALAEHGVSFGKPSIDLDKVRAWKQSVSQGLNQCLARLVKQRNITLIQGVGKFASANSLVVEGENGTQTIRLITQLSQPVLIQPKSQAFLMTILVCGIRPMRWN